MTYALDLLNSNLTATEIRANCIKLKKIYCGVHHIVEIFSMSAAMSNNAIKILILVYASISKALNTQEIYEHRHKVIFQVTKQHNWTNIPNTHL